LQTHKNVYPQAYQLILILCSLETIKVFSSTDICAACQPSATIYLEQKIKDKGAM
jgi:hypothetical protein